MTTKRRLTKKIGQPVVKQSTRILGSGIIDESRTTVFNGECTTRRHSNSSVDPIDNSCDLSHEEGESGEERMPEKPPPEADTVMTDINVTVEDLGPEVRQSLLEPSFGDLVRASVSEPINVASEFGDVLSHTNKCQVANLRPTPGASLGAVLSQALQTNDISLLETCLHTVDVRTIRATIQRLESTLAAKLLQKLAERLHKRPGIAGNLMVWVQWTLVAHGGYLATQKGLVKSLAELTRVIDERSKGLQSVLILKGKLDMLEAQIEMRRSVQDYRRRLDEEVDGDSIIYVEDQEDETKEDKSASRLSLDGDLEDVSDEMPTINGMIAESDSEQEYSSDDDNMVDDEAEDAGSDLTDEEADVNYDDGSIGDVGDSSDVVPVPKMEKA